MPGWLAVPGDWLGSLIVLGHIIGMVGTLVFWGANPTAPIGG
jgi:hypothetical protein